MVKDYPEIEGCLVDLTDKPGWIWRHPEDYTHLIGPNRWEYATAISSGFYCGARSSILNVRWMLQCEACAAKNGVTW